MEMVDRDDGGDEAVRAFMEDMGKLQMGQKLLFINDFQGAESVFSSGVMRKRNGVGEKEGLRDLRGAFALMHAFTAVLKGVASLADDQLAECLERLWNADALAAEEKEWLGRSLVRGLCTLMGGIIQCLQHNFIKGVFNVLRSWLWIKVLQSEGLDYKGKERQVIRSCALLTLGIFNLLLSMLPTSMLRTASVLSGFEGDRDAGLSMLIDCWREEGMFSPWGALVWAVYTVDTKSFLDETLSPSDEAMCIEIFTWARERFPNSVFFSGIEADFEACRKNVQLAKKIVEEAAPYASDLKALQWALSYKKAVYELTDLQFENAAGFFEDSLRVYVRVGRRSLVPFMAMYSALCYHVVADEKARSELEQDELELDTGEQEEVAEDDVSEPEMDAATAAAHAEEMLGLVYKYKELPKTDWGRQDRWAFELYSEFDASQIEAAESYAGTLREPWPLLEITESMIYRMRCTRWMEDLQTARLLQMLQDEQDLRPADPDDGIRVCACFAQVLIERGQLDPSLEWCEKGLALQKELSEIGDKKNYVLMLHYQKAVVMFRRGLLLSSKHSISKLESTERTSSWIYNYTLFKANILRKQIAAAEVKVEYQTIEIAAGNLHKERVRVEEPGGMVAWDWVCNKYDIQFSAMFRPDDDDFDIQIPANFERHSHEDGPCVGAFCAPCRGAFILTWNNGHSLLRSKTIISRVNVLPPVKHEDL